MTRVANQRPAHLRSPGSERWRGRCAYCGEDGADEPDHVVPGCLYPRGWAPDEYLTVPSHAACNRSFSAAEMSFKEDISTAGSNDAAAATRETVLSSFRRPPTHHRGRQLLERLHEGRIYPFQNPDTLRVLRKVVRGLAFYHALFIALPEDRVTVSPTKYEIPPAFVPDARIHEVRHSDIFESLGFVIDDLGDEPAGPEDAHSFWRLRFYDRVRFDAWIGRPP